MKCLKRSFSLFLFVLLFCGYKIYAQAKTNYIPSVQNIFIGEFYDSALRKEIVVRKLKESLKNEGFNVLSKKEKADITLSIKVDVWFVLDGDSRKLPADKYKFSLKDKDEKLIWSAKISVPKTTTEKQVDHIIKHFVKNLRKADLETNLPEQNTAELILENDVKAHKGMDSIYKTFSESYRTLKPEMVANLYTEDAAYLSPNNDITNGRSAILENFTSFFQNVKKRGQNMTISFQIFQRRAEKKMGYDVGIYTIDFFKDGKKVGESKGKFVVVAVKGKDKKWRFQVDGYSSLKPPQNN